MLKIRVTGLSFSDGTVVRVPQEGAVLFVGPNNAGKSQALKDLIGHLRDSAYNGRALTSVELDKDSDQPIAEWVEDHLTKLNRDGVWRYQVPGWGEVQTSDIASHWAQPKLGPLTELFFLHADGTTRLTAGNSQQSLDFSVSMAVHPVQRAYMESDLEAAIDNESRAAFGVGVAVDRYGGSVISLRIGDCPSFAHDNGRPTQEYLRQLKALPRLEDQGDGVRSYLGLFLHIAAGHHEALLIDEPEAFLHPPQARRLGSVLAGRAQKQQAFIATHSADVVRGALEGGSSITIVRITRQGDVNQPAVLDDEAVKNLWSDPLLRYSNVLDGLFHDAVVLCESDADCRYYSAVLDNLQGDDATDGAPSGPRREPQLLFTHCGGKARMPSVANALRAVSVPVIVVADFDVLRDPADVKAIVASLGGDFSEVEADLRVIAAALESDAKPLRRVTLKDELGLRLDALTNESLSHRDIETLRALIKSENGWDKAKRAGLGAVPQGDAYQACERVLEKLRALRLLVVPVGELERFAPGVPGHGPSWVTAVLEQNLHQSPSAEAVAFVNAIRESAIV
jgi:hypothetical protein